MRHVVGCVPYVNAKPLVSYFEHHPESPVHVIYDLPSRLPQMINEGRAGAALVSSFEALRTPGRRIADHGSISSLADAASVRLFSKVPIKEIKTLALDDSSLTSVHLAQVVLIENYDVQPTTVRMMPDLESMLERCDACLLIGDKGMIADGTGLTVLDMGHEWLKLTDLPFVWAAWIGGDDLDEDLATELARSASWGQQHLTEVIEETQAVVHWPDGWCDRYLRKVMNYDLTPAHFEGLRHFQKLLIKHEFLREDHFPEIVKAASVLAG